MTPPVSHALLKQIMIQKSSILTVGSVAFDTIETPDAKVDFALGGAANYFSVAASLYSPVSVVAVVGEDFPKSHLEWLESRQVDVSGIKVVAGGKSFHWAGSYDRDFNEAKTLSTALNVFEHFNPVLDRHHQDAPFLFLANIDPVLQHRVLDQVKSPRLVACDSMNFWIAGKPDDLKKTLKRVDILSINEGEARLLSGEKNLFHAAKVIQKMGPSVLIIKRGSNGAMLFNGSKVFISPAFPVQTVVDPTGAGDTFAGGVMGYLAEANVDRSLAQSDPHQWDLFLRRAILAGVVMASFTVEDFSFNRISKLKRGELVERQNALIEMLRL